MTSRDFCYWLQGYFELTGNNIVSENQVQCIKNHLNLVFKHEIDPSIDLGNVQVKLDLQKIHDKLPHDTKAVEDLFQKETYRC